MNGDFLGLGWSFPPDFTGPMTGVAMLEDDRDVASSLQILLSTTPGERVMQPLYGCNLSELVFENLDDSRTLEGIVLIQVVYQVKTTNSRFNFVYPYYIQEGTDINLTTTINLLPGN